MSNAPSTYRRRLGRAPSPPTWLWYEQIPFDDDTSDTDNSAEYESCSEDDEEYHHVDRGRDAQRAEPDPDGSESGSDDQPQPQRNEVPVVPPTDAVAPLNEKMDVEGSAGDDAHNKEADVGGCEEKTVKDIKGKQRAVEPEVDESPKRRERRKKHREPVITLRPILTIQKSQGFVWNQDLFVPPYIKDRYVASTSPPNASGFVSTSASSLSSINDYEVDVVEIRVKEGEYADIIP